MFLASSPMSVSARLTDNRKEKKNTEASNFEDVSRKSSKVLGIKSLSCTELLAGEIRQEKRSCLLTR